MSPAPARPPSPSPRRAFQRAVLQLASVNGRDPNSHTRVMSAANGSPRPPSLTQAPWMKAAMQTPSSYTAEFTPTAPPVQTCSATPAHASAQLASNARHIHTERTEPVCAPEPNLPPSTFCRSPAPKADPGSLGLSSDWCVILASFDGRSHRPSALGPPRRNAIHATHCARHRNSLHSASLAIVGSLEGRVDSQSSHPSLAEEAGRASNRHDRSCRSAAGVWSNAHLAQPACSCSPSTSLRSVTAERDKVTRPTCSPIGVLPSRHSSEPRRQALPLRGASQVGTLKVTLSSPQNHTPADPRANSPVARRHFGPSPGPCPLLRAIRALPYDDFYWPAAKLPLARTRRANPTHSGRLCARKHARFEKPAFSCLPDFFVAAAM
ncbi:hypothetical protein DAEQUDRAFT_690986 [Daedalea quercina L-15889]|uniref:Uncharacterized protein n=1 Tax=Daedalea quercina L-15889 TaxID=1314783 RepID=A0A165QGP6_9APHY|nr:hypothetical protein DAEQUDRAFT_690986 [Daedalea quercina L-15889]